jgi:hypothetical protein
MKRLLIAIAAAVLLVAAGVIAVIAWRSTRPVTVVIENEGPTGIRSAMLVHEEGAVALGGIPTGETRTAHFHPHGETAYHLTLVFDDGATLKGGGNYAEPGYGFRDHVRAGSIVNELVTLPPL